MVMFWLINHVGIQHPIPHNLPGLLSSQVKVFRLVPQIIYQEKTKESEFPEDKPEVSSAFLQGNERD